MRPTAVVEMGDDPIPKKSLGFSLDPLEISRDRMISFSEKFDPQPFHLDTSAAARTLLNGLAASAWYLCARIDEHLRRHAPSNGLMLDDVTAAEQIVLFLQGGAYALFGTIAMNFGGPGRVGAYVVAGHWSQRAAREAKPWINVHHAAHGDGCKLPAPDNWNVPQAATYCHYTSNESAEGLQFPVMPQMRAVPLISDMTADFLTRPLDMRNFGLVYASSQKNLGIGGLTVVILSKSLLALCSDKTPAPFNFGRQAREGSKVNTPPLFAIAVARHVCRWLQNYGGLEAAKERSNRKARLIYRMIEKTGFYSSPVEPEFRSLVSIRFHLPTAQLEAAFLDRAHENGLLHLQGHPEVGGIRASLYNLVPLQAVEVLSDFMEEFRRVSG